MTDTALSSVGFDYRAAYKGDQLWRPADRSNTLQSTSHDAPWPADRHEITLEVSAGTAASAWFQQAVEDLVTLLNLGPNWNGYGERAVHPASAKRLVRMLDQIKHRGQPPAIVPLPDGGVQAEWHRAELSLELEVPPVGDAIAWTCGARGRDDEWVANSGDGLERLAKSLSELNVE